MTRQQAIAYLDANHNEPCCHGHFSCAERLGGACSNEVYANALGRGWIDEGGNELKTFSKLNRHED